MEQLRLRARLLASVRDFFRSRDVLEVETPLLCHAAGTDPQLEFFATRFDSPPSRQTLYLQTSPEFAMKRLLAAGSGSIYQICKAFRNGESGRYHNPEFTILEWYRLDFRMPDLMREVGELMTALLTPHFALQPVQSVGYQALFFTETGLDPLDFKFDAYCRYARERNFPEAIDICRQDHAMWLDLIFSLKIQPGLGNDAPCLVHGYPAVQSSLARISESDCRVADRFEIFFKGVELGNGFFELADPFEQERRFDKEIEERRKKRLPAIEKDYRLLAALESGLPDCSGVAVGLDRMLMLIAGVQSIDQVLAFPVARA